MDNKLHEKEIENLAMVISSVKLLKDFKLYRNFIPESLLEKSKTAKTVEEYLDEIRDDKALGGNIYALDGVLRAAKRTITFSTRTKNRYRYGISTGERPRIKDPGRFRIVWDKIVKSDRHMEVLDYISTRGKKGKKTAKLKIEGCVGELMVRSIIKQGKVDDEFITFITEGKGVKYFNVESKKLVVEYLHKNNRLDDMYRFSGAGSKTVNDLVIRLADVNDLPFLMGAEGCAAKRSLEKRINKGSK